MPEITIDNAKLVKELYLRNLTTDQSNYIKALQVKFQKIRSTEAGSLALFGYFKLEGRYEEEKRANAELRNELREAKANFENLKMKVKKHFQLEGDLLISKETLLEAINEPGKPQAMLTRMGS
ncbi:hypothetical protein [Mucilaginibacter sp. UYCu711]|uniref:hypothetical protein n=1 Tax=Mucilaginibacter sp. UYCu711 TaxID=3156339 RepID=UPI003D1EA23A